METDETDRNRDRRRLNSMPDPIPLYQDLSRFRVEPDFRGRPEVVVLIWQIMQATLFAWSPQPFYAWRRGVLKVFGATVGKNVLIRPTARITYPWKVTLGDYCWIGDHVELYSLGPIDIGAHTVISQRSYICSGSHDSNDISFPLLVRPVRIGAEAWIATDCFVAPGVTIGRGAIVAARSTVLLDVAEATVVAGTPAVFKKGRQPAGVSL